VGEKRNAYSENLKGKRQLDGRRGKWESNKTYHLNEIEWDGVDWIHLAQNRAKWRAHVYMVFNIGVP
jgi:hypothetical protein